MFYFTVLLNSSSILISAHLLLDYGVNSYNIGTGFGYIGVAVKNVRFLHLSSPAKQTILPFSFLFLFP